MIEATAPLTITLEAQQWQQMLGVLAEGGPWRVVNPLIQKISEQLQAADAAGLAPVEPAQLNGSAEHVPH